MKMKPVRIAVTHKQARDGEIPDLDQGSPHPAHMSVEGEPWMLPNSEETAFEKAVDRYLVEFIGALEPMIRLAQQYPQDERTGATPVSEAINRALTARNQRSDRSRLEAVKTEAALVPEQIKVIEAARKIGLDTEIHTYNRAMVNVWNEREMAVIEIRENGKYRVGWGDGYHVSMNDDVEFNTAEEAAEKALEEINKEGETE